MRLSDIMGSLDLSIWPQLALGIFLVVFAAVITRVYRRDRRREYDAAARIPLESGVVTPRTVQPKGTDQ
ncbi:MAG: CcoQ/FixQ family Cbb3-type cytochrome c oxidase assembly chaperone [Planctomycetota bacterium]|nr:CcoQ/FixQ family Cbb3-type cytochrome c oxidase assembly chaperone [Planctomycetota bacterium]